MTIRLTTRARSPLGQCLALAGVALPLIILGLYLALGDLSSGDTVRMQVLLNSLFSSKPIQQAGRDFSQALGTHFRTFSRVELITYYGFAILVGFMLQGVLGRVIRSYRFSFLARQGVIVRQGLWLFMPAWTAAWLLLTLLSFLLVGWSHTVMLWVPLWLPAALGGAGVAWWVAWAWLPEFLEGKIVYLPLRFTVLRLPVWTLAVPALAVALALVALALGMRQMLPIALPWCVLLAAVVPPVLLLPAWLLKPAWVKRALFIPGLRRQVPFGRIKRMEVQSGAEGGTALVLTFRDDWTWTIARGTPQRLQRLGAAVGRVAGLHRRDLVTWN